MRDARRSRLVLALAAPLLLAAAIAAGYAQRPSEADAGLEAYLLLGGDPAGLCGGDHAPGHAHCDGCQSMPPVLLAPSAAPSAGTLRLAAAGMPVAVAVAGSSWRSAAAPRGPPGRGSA